MSDRVKYFLDIRADVCPMTFVKTRLLIERMSSGEMAEILLRGSEPVENVPASITELGHTIVSIGPLISEAGETDDAKGGDVRLVVRRTG